MRVTEQGPICEHCNKTEADHRWKFGRQWCDVDSFEFKASPALKFKQTVNDSGHTVKRMVLDLQIKSLNDQIEAKDQLIDVLMQTLAYAVKKLNKK